MATLRALEALVALVDTGSVTRAAAALQLSQPALSHQIAALEKEIGAPVVERLGRGVRVTSAGRAAVDEARIALRAADQAIRLARQVGAGASGRLRIACAETMTAWLLVPVLRHWRARHAGVVLELAEHSSADHMLDLVTSGQVDLAVCPHPTQSTEHIEVLGQEEAVLVAPTGHRFAERLSIPFAELADEPFVHYATDNGLSAWLDNLAAQHGIVLDPVLRTRSPRTAAQLAAAGMGVTIVPVSALPSRPPGVVRRLAPAVHRDVVVVLGAPSDVLVARFVADLRRRGMPSAHPLVAG